ncbi:MAG: sensor domain-containing diguanylate cyclase [Alphaproteobacteria bacterium]|nr:sensor domain-containing diguanylate cyclase [Alphaproteobacteria bacterium]MDD9920567.1 sensor domain-containing diguanylate cyclase [Alphaproteobacteria bacterium]
MSYTKRPSCSPLPLADADDGVVVPITGAAQPLEIPQVDARDLYTAALAYSPFGIAFLDECGHLQHVNKTLSEWLKQPMAQLADMTLSQFIWEEDQLLFERVLKRVFKRGQTHHDIELRLTGSRGQPRWVSLSLSRLPVMRGQQVAVYMSDITRRKKTERELLQLANTDHLTGLSNRMVFDETLKRAVKNAQRYDRPGAVLYIDLNDFKKINDSYGHKAGDAILQELGRVLQNLFRDTDTVSRIGGDEFAVIMEEISASQAEFKGKVVERAVKKISLEVDGETLSCSASVGVKFFCGAETQVEDILTAVDQAMYERKSEHKGISLHG